MGVLICLRESGLVGMGAMFGGACYPVPIAEIVVRLSDYKVMSVFKPIIFRLENAPSSSKSASDYLIKAQYIFEGEPMGYEMVRQSSRAVSVYNVGEEPIGIGDFEG